MAVAKNVLMKAIVEDVGGTGSATVYFRSNVNLYGNEAFGTATGIAPATGPDKANVPNQIKNLVRGGFLWKCFVVIKGDETDPAIRRTVLVANNKLASFKAWASAGTNNLPGGPARAVIAGGVRMVRMTLK